MKIAIIGAGAVGSSIARFLSDDKQEVHLFEQFSFYHNRGSSHGTSRITRKTYPDPLYTRLMTHATELWKELERQTGETLYVETGLITLGRPTNEWLKQCRQSLVQNKIPFEELSPVEVARRFGGFHLEPDEVALYEPSAGFLRADSILQVNLHLALQNGTHLHPNTPARISPSGEVNGEKFDALFVCAGSWLPKILKPLLSNLPKLQEPEQHLNSLKVHLQHFAYFRARVEPTIPVWIDSAEDHAYGFPNYGKGFKVGRHFYGPEIDPDAPRNTLKEETKALAHHAHLRLGAEAEPLEVHACLYTVAPQEDFRIFRLPLNIPAFAFSCCSGHGFKFSAWMGWLARELLQGTAKEEDYSRFFVDLRTIP